jgi:serine phosphatase RsbU (regulator of sigma subunit)
MHPGLRTNGKVFLPLFLILFAIWYSGEQWLGRNEQEAFRREETRGRLTVQELATRSEPGFFIRSRILGILNSWDMSRISQRGSAVEAHLGGRILVYSFDTQKQLIGTYPRTAPNRRVMSRLISLLTTHPDNDASQAGQQLARQIGFLIGEEKTLHVLRKARGKVLDTKVAGRKGFFTWTWGSRGGVIIVGLEIPAEKEIFRLTCAPLRIPLGDAGFGNQESGTLVSGEGKPDLTASRARSALRERGVFSGVFENRRWVFEETSSGRIVFASFPLMDHGPFAWKQAFRIFGALLCGTLLLAGSMTQDVLAGMSLRRLLLGSFAMAGIIPVTELAITFIGFSTLSSHGYAAQMESVAGEALAGIQGEFDEDLLQKAEIIRRALTARANKALSLQQTGLLGDMRRLGLDGKVTFRDASGNPLSWSGTPLPRTQEMLARSLSRRAIEVHAPARAAAVSYSGSSVTDRLVRTDDLDLQLLNKDQFQFLQAGQDHFLIFFHVFCESGVPAAYAEIRVPFRNAVQAFLKSRARQPGRQRTVGLRLCAFDTRNFHWTVPPPPGMDGPFRRLALRSWMTGLLQSGHFRLRGGGGYVSTLFQPRLADHSLVLWCSDDERRAIQSTARRNVWLGLTVFGFLVLSLGRALRTHLIQPLRSLESGIEALAARQFRFRINVSREDELGRLFKAYDNMMESSHELHLARHVQEGLLPQTFPQPPGFSLAGQVTMASDLGGDILLAFSLPEEKLAFLVGDSSGHGVSAALLMAFTRAVAFHWKDRPDPTAANLAEDLNRALLDRPAPRTFLSAVCGILDPGRGEISLTVQGGIYPLVVRHSSEEPQWHGQPALPLGIPSTRRRFSTLVIALEPGDALLCATDGFIEARARNGEHIGYDRFARWAQDSHAGLPVPSESPARDYLKELFNRLAAWSKDAPEDDVTLFTLIRRSAR